MSRHDNLTRAFKPVGILYAFHNSFVFECLDNFLKSQDSLVLGGLALQDPPFVSERLSLVFADWIIGAHLILRF